MLIPSPHRAQLLDLPGESARQDENVIERFLSAPGEESFSSLFHVIAPWMFRYFRIRGCDVAMAEDFTQEVMMTVFRAGRTLRSQDRFRPWLYRVARNVLLRHFRDSSRRVATVGLGPEAEETREQCPDPSLHCQFSEWMACLNADERQVMTLRYVDELEHHEIAAMLELPVGTVQWKIFNAKKKLAARFGTGAT